jgi:hypothetical protein
MITLPLTAEIKDATTLAGARATLDAFREAVQPSTQYGIVFYEPPSNALQPVIIKLTEAEVSIVHQPPTVSVILIDLDDLRIHSNTTLAFDLIDQVRAAKLPAQQIETLVAEITTAAQHTCARCETPIPLGKDESTPSGSMHDECAHEYERESPEDF